MSANTLMNESGTRSSEVSRLSTQSATAKREDILEYLSPIEEPTDKTANPEKNGTQIQTGLLTRKILPLPQFNKVPSLLLTPFELLQEWEGYVQTVGSSEFTASLIDLTQKRDIEEEEADFSIDDLTDEDKKLLKPGAVFRWLIGYRSIGGTKERISKIVFRRLPQWTEGELRESREKAKKIANAITWE